MLGFFHKLSLFKEGFDLTLVIAFGISGIILIFTIDFAAKKIRKWRHKIKKRPSTPGNFLD